MSDAMIRKIPANYNLVQDMLTPGRITAVISGKCHGKSFFVEQLALCVGEWFDETDFLGYFTPHTRVLLLDVDGEADMTDHRIRHMTDALRCETPMGYWDRRLKIRDVRYDETKIDDLCDMIYRECSEIKPGLIIIDPIWQCASEEDEQSVEHLFDRLRGLCADFGCAIVFTHFPHGGYIADFADIKIDLGDADPFDHSKRPSMYLPRTVRVEATSVRAWNSRKIGGNLPFKVAFSYPIFERAVRGKAYGPDERYVDYN